MERRVWTVSYGEPLYPNLYVLLVGEPGGGKTFPIKIGRKLLKSVPDFFVAPTSFTGASLGDALNGAKRRIVRPASIPPYIEFNSLHIVALEFSSMLPAWDGAIINRLTDLWDCGPFEETRRSRNEPIVINETQLNLLAGTTPSFLNELMPLGAWDQGFISRVIMVFSAETIRNPLFEERKVRSALQTKLIDDLKVIAALYGKMEWEPDAAAAIDAWHQAGNPPEVDHPKLRHYNSRRTAHLVKLTMVASMSRLNNAFRVTLDDYQTALDWLISAEFFMPDIFKAMVTGGDSAAIDETFHFVFTFWTQKKKPVPEHLITQFLMQRVPNHSVVRILELMQRSNMISVEGIEHGRATYKPIAKQAHKG